MCHVVTNVNATVADSLRCRMICGTFICQEHIQHNVQEEQNNSIWQVQQG